MEKHTLKAMEKNSTLSKEDELNDHFDLSDDEFVKKLKNCTLSSNLFNHEAHLRLAWIHIKNSGVIKATELTCDQLIAFVAHLGAQGKYNKTLTVAAVEIVNHFTKRSKSNNFYDFMIEFPRLKTSFKELVESHYSFDIFNSEEAKSTFLEPDLSSFG